ncbi:MAG TPA: hypothetical protein VGE52_01225 [Pirellulales bacterium]
MSAPVSNRPTVDRDFPFVQRLPEPPGPADPRTNVQRWMYLPIGAVVIGPPVAFVAAFTRRGDVALVAVLAFIAGLIAWRFVRQWVNRVTLDALRDKVSARPDKLLDPGDRQAFQVRLIGQGEWSPDLDVEDGFCAVDEEGRRFLYEGDHLRCEVPFTAIHSSSVRQTLSRRVIRERNGYYDFFVVCLELENGSARRTLPFQVIAWNAVDPPYPLTSQKGAAWLTDRIRAITHKVGPIEDGR